MKRFAEAILPFDLENIKVTFDGVVNYGAPINTERGEELEDVETLGENSVSTAKANVADDEQQTDGTSRDEVTKHTDFNDGEDFS